jgi:DNA invertase Pin-like site-specific DNA recombinase
MTAAAIIYGAKSSADPHGSIGTQLADCRAAAEAEGREILGEYSDEAASAYSGNRGAGLTAAKDAATAAGAELWVQHSDRLARGDGLTADHLAEVFFAMRRAGVRLRSVQDDKNLEDAIRAVMIGERNHEDSARKAAAVRSGKQRAAAAGKWCGGLIPDGYMGPGLELDPDRAPIIRRALELGLRGTNSGEAARALNRDGVLARGGRRWTPCRVRQLWKLASTFYAGRQVDGAPGSWPALCTLEEAERLGAILEARAAERAPSTPPGRRSSRHLLAHLLHCERCGAPMHARTSGPRADGTRARRYRCSRAKAAAGGCDAPAISAERLEAPFVVHLENLTIGLDAFVSRQAVELEAQREQLTRALERERAGLAEVERLAELVRVDYARHLGAGRADAAALGVDTLADLARRREQARHRADELLEALAAVPAAPDADALATLVGTLRDALAGRLEAAESVGDANARLREAISAVDVEQLEGGAVRLTAYMSDAFLMSVAGDAVAEFTLPVTGHPLRRAQGPAP